MIFINKKQEPKSLLEYRANKSNLADITYDNFRDKDDVRDALLVEQGHICAYCMQRITKDKMKIEHFSCQSINETLQLEYKNMLGCCMGGEGQDEDFQHCDTKKKSKKIKFNPSNPNDKNSLKISYDHNGLISSKDDEFNKDLNEVLSLNLELFKNNRKAVLLQLYESFSKVKRNATKKDCEERLLKFSKPKNGMLPEYCGIAIYYINKKMVKFS